MTEPRKPIDWEAIEREYRAGQLSLREIGRQYELSEGAIRKRAKAERWERALSDKVRSAVREKLVRADGTQQGTQEQRTSDRQIVEGASLRGFELVTSHRRDLAQLHALKRIIATRLAAYLNGEPIDGPCIGDKETPGDLVEKLSRVTSRLIPLERQAHNLDEAGDDEPARRSDVRSARELIASRIAGIVARNGADGSAAKPE